MASDISTAPTSLAVTSSEYVERVYAGVLGKIIGVYLGRPFEGWTHERIVAELGEIDRYVYERFGMPLIVTDDDIAGTFTFPRALEDNGFDPNLSPAQIGEGWLNYLIDQRTVLWWGGMGVSTEHTAFRRLQDGIEAPASGSRTLNGATISEQIGAQIFIDAWAMLFPGDPERAADWARRAASVSHDGEAVHGAQVVAAIEAQAFVERDVESLIETALRFIPRDSTIARLIADVREWHAAHDDWYATRRLIGERYGYDKYPGACHMVPNHALIILALLHGNGDFRRSLMIANTAGWDTDCNSGNVGAILGIRDGLAAFRDADDYRLPVADRLYLSTAEGGRGISDAVREAYRIVNDARALVGAPTLAPKDGARFHFSLPGSMQGFTADAANVTNADASLRITLKDGTATVTTPTFAPEESRVFRQRGYRLFASPTLYPGQEVVANVTALAATTGPVTVSLLIRAYDENDVLVEHAGPEIPLAAGDADTLRWTIPPLENQPIQQVGLRIAGASGDSLAIDALTWDGSPSVTFRKGVGSGDMWRQAWVNGVDIWEPRWAADFQLSQNRGTGLIAQGTEEWRDYTVSAPIRTPLAASAGIAARIGGMRRWYALVLREGGRAQLVKCVGDIRVLADAPFAWEADADYAFTLRVEGNRLQGTIDGTVTLDAIDGARPLRGGGTGLVVELGTVVSGPITVRPVRKQPPTTCRKERSGG
jgi:ADP-ribosylglycohydrolase